MLRARSVLAKSLLMLRGRVALVLVEAVRRKLTMQLGHDAVSGHLGDYRSGGDATGDAVALPHRQARHVEARDREAVGQDVRRLHVELSQRAAHTDDVADVQSPAVDLLR